MHGNRRRPKIVGSAVVLAVLTGCSSAYVAAPASARVQVATPLPTDAQPLTGYQLYTVADEFVVNGRNAGDSFGVTSLVALPDGTVFAIQDAVVPSAGNEEEELDEGEALVRITPDGRAELVGSPYGLRAAGREVRLRCAADDGTLYALDDQDDYRLVARSPTGIWRTVTASAGGNLAESTGDGGPATEATVGRVRGCAVGVDGSLYLAEDCLVRRIDPQGIIDVVAGRRDRGVDRGAGCGSVDFDNRLDPPQTPLPRYDGPADQAELGEVAAIAAAPDGSIWLSAIRGVQRLTPDGRLRSIDVPTELDGPSEIGDLAVTADGTVLAVFGISWLGLASRDAASGGWEVLVDPEAYLSGAEVDLVEAATPAPLTELSLYGTRLAVAQGRLYLGQSAGLNAGIVVVPWPG